MEIVTYLNELLSRLNDLKPVCEEEMWDLHHIVLEDESSMQEWLRYEDLKDEIIPAIKDSIHHLDRLIDNIQYLTDENVL